MAAAGLLRALCGRLFSHYLANSYLNCLKVIETCFMVDGEYDLFCQMFPVHMEKHVYSAVLGGVFNDVN